MECEICADQVVEEHSDVPVEEDYYVWVEYDEEGLGTDKREHKFCSIEHLQLFAEPVGVE